MAAPPAYPETNQWLMAEDEALKKLVSGITIPSLAKPVQAYFRFPEAERQIVYPFITIDLIGIEPAYDLWTSWHEYDEREVEFVDEHTLTPVKTGLYEPSVSDSIWTVPDVGLDPSKPFRRANYLQYRLFYQVTTWAKTFAHDRFLTAKLIRDIFHPRPSWLQVEADKTWRRMEPLGWQPADIPTQEGGIKRIFRKAFTLSVQSEITQDQLDKIEQRAAVTRVLLRGFFIDFPGEYWTEDETTDYWEVIVGDESEMNMTMTPGIYNFTVYRGDSYGWRFVMWEDKERTIPADLTGATAESFIRAGSVLLNLGCTVQEAEHAVDVALTSEDSATLTQGGTWDLAILRPGQKVRTVLAGDVTLQEDVR